MFQTCLVLNSLVHTNVKGIVKGLIGLINSDEKVASTKKHAQFKTRVQNPHNIKDQNKQKFIPYL